MPSSDETGESHDQDHDQEASIVEFRGEIEADLLARAREAYPATRNKNELVRRLIERGLMARERELADVE